MAPESLTARLVTASRQLTAAVEAVLAAEQLTVDDWLVVEALAGVDELAMTDLRARTLTSAPTLSRVVDRLATRALLFREVDATDRRRVRLHLSKRGEALHRRVGPLVAEAEQAWSAARPAAEPV